MGMIQVYRNGLSGGSVITIGADVGAGFDPSGSSPGVTLVDDYHAFGNGDGTISIGSLSRNTLLVNNRPFAEFIDNLEVAHGASESETVDSLNAVFHFTSPPSGLAPVITSALTINGNAGETVNYQITADNIPVFFDASGLPSGISLNQRTGHLLGVMPAVGSYGITISAVNHHGIDTQAANIESTVAYINQKSTLFTRNQKTYVSNLDVSVAPEPGDAWTLNFWLKRTADKDMGIVFFGESAGPEEGWYIEYMKADNKLKVRGGDTGGGDYVEWISANTVVGDMLWHQYTVQYNGALPLNAAGITVWKDGVDITVGGTTGSNGSFAAAAWFGVARMLLLARNPAGSNNRYLDAYVDEVSLWTDELSAGNVALLRNGTVPADISGMGIFAADCEAWWRMGDGDTWPTATDNTANGHTITLLNGTSAMFVNDVPV